MRNRQIYVSRYALGLFVSCFLIGAISLILSSVKLMAQSDSADQSNDSTSDSSMSIEKQATSTKHPLVFTLTVDGAIGVVTDERIGEAIELAVKQNAELLIILLDTPGGFTSATWSINKKLLNSPLPVCIYVSPSGARAGSAGVYMTYAAHFAAMATSTNIGAAHPVSGDGKEVDSLMNEKVTNDAVAQIKAAAAKRGRNAEWAEKAVRESVSITNDEALELGVIDIVAEDLDDLLEQLDGREADIGRETRTLNLKEARVEHIEISFFQELRRLITDPSVAFILFSMGSLGIMLELYNPGSIFPGVIGVISLILSFYAFQTLPINYAGAALILLAIVLFIAEIKVISHGLLTIGGVVSLILGGTLLIDDVDPAVQVSKTVLFTVGGFVLVVLLAVLFLIARVARRKPFVGEDDKMGKRAIVKDNGYVYIDGALWKVECAEALVVGEKVEIIGYDGLTLKVKKLNS